MRRKLRSTFICSEFTTAFPGPFPAPPPKTPRERRWSIYGLGGIAIVSSTADFWDVTQRCVTSQKQLRRRLVSQLLAGNIYKPRRERQRERRQTNGLMSKTTAVHVRYKSLYISLPFSAKQQREMTKFCIFWRTYATTANISDFVMELIAGITYLVWAGF